MASQIEKPRHINFQFLTSKGKTHVWEIVTTGYGPFTLGVVKWYGPWRKYAFFPQSETIFEQVCLRDIAAFCEEKTREHRSQRKCVSSS